MQTAALLSLATSVPPHAFLQKDVLAAAWDFFGSRFPDFERFASIFANTGIVKRHGVKPFEWYLEPRGWPERTDAFLRRRGGAVHRGRRKGVGERGCSRGRNRYRRDGLLDRHRHAEPRCAGPPPHGLSIRRLARAGVRPWLRRRSLGPLDRLASGAGAARHQRAAWWRSNSARSRFGSTNSPRPNIIATSLFGDGAAAMVLRAGDGGATRIEHVGEHLWPDTLDVMGWSVDPLGFGVILRRTVPEFVTTELKPALTEILSRMQLDDRRYRQVHLPSRRRQGDQRASRPRLRSTRGRSSTNAR